MSDQNSKELHMTKSYVMQHFVPYSLFSDVSLRKDITLEKEALKRILGGTNGRLESSGLWYQRHECVAERTSYFCLARNLIWPLGSTHIFTQWGWLILFSLDHLSKQHQKLGKAAKTFSLPQNSSIRTDVLLSALQ